MKLRSGKLTLLILFMLGPFLGAEPEPSKTTTTKTPGINPKCIEHALNSSFPKWPVGKASEGFADCPTENSLFRSMGVRPKYTNDEIGEFTEIFNQTTSCLGVDPKLMYPLLVGESGFHPGIKAANGMDAGVGQLTQQAITDVESSFQSLQLEINNAKKSDCQAIQNRIIKVGSELFWEPAGQNSRCAFITRRKGINPLKNILYAVKYFKMQSNYIDRLMAKENTYVFTETDPDRAKRVTLSEPEYKTTYQLLDEVGFPPERMEMLKGQLRILAYNAGPSGAVKSLNQFLFDRADFIRRKKVELQNMTHDFSADKIHQLTYGEIQRKLGFVTDSDFDSTQDVRGLNRERASILREKILFEHQRAISKGGPRVLTETQIQAKIKEGLRNVSASERSFPESLLTWQVSGGPGSLSGVARQALEVEQGSFGLTGLCTDLDYFKIPIEKPRSEVEMTYKMKAKRFIDFMSTPIDFQVPVVNMPLGTFLKKLKARWEMDRKFKQSGQDQDANR